MIVLPMLSRNFYEISIADRLSTFANVHVTLNLNFKWLLSILLLIACCRLLNRFRFRNSCARIMVCPHSCQFATTCRCAISGSHPVSYPCRMHRCMCASLLRCSCQRCITTHVFNVVHLCAHCDSTSSMVDICCFHSVVSALRCNAVNC